MITYKYFSLFFIVLFTLPKNFFSQVIKTLFSFLFFQLHYVSPNLGAGGTASPTAFTTVFAYIGTPPQLRRQSRLTWKQGPCHLLEDIVSTNTVQTMYQLGPVYIGSFQAAILSTSSSYFYINTFSFFFFFFIKVVLSYI